MKKVLAVCSLLLVAHCNSKTYLPICTAIHNFALKKRFFFIPDVYDEQDAWKLPDKHLRYDQVHCVTAHNAHTYAAKFKIYFQQIWNLQEQLDHGIRGFMLDTHWYNDDIYLAHGKTEGYHALQLGVFNGLWGLITDDIEYDKFTDALHIFKQWLDDNPDEIITIFLENHTTNQNIVDALDTVPGLHEMILSKNDWDHAAHNFHWPTLGWMRSHNKRVVIFTGQHGKDPLLFYTWHYIMESDYSTTKPETVCAGERAKSAKFSHLTRYLVTINFFPKIQKDGLPLPFNTLHRSRKRNSYESLKHLLQTCASLNFAGKRPPNFLALDFVNVGNPMKLVNELNALEIAKVS